MSLFNYLTFDAALEGFCSWVLNHWELKLFIMVRLLDCSLGHLF